MEKKRPERREPRRRKPPEDAGNKKAPKKVKKRPVLRRSRSADAPRMDRMTREVPPETVYAAPEPFNKRKFLLQAFSVAAAVVALSFAMTVFFRVGSVPTEDPKAPMAKIMVSGTEKYTPYMIAEASGIQPGDSLLSFGIARACGRITSALPYVKDVRIGIKLPDTVNIEITEYDVVYAMKSQQGGWWLVTAGGKVTESVDSAAAAEKGVVSGVLLDNPKVGAQAKAGAAPAETVPEGEEAVPVTRPSVVTPEEQLAVALSILQRLEQNNIIGKIASLDVSDLGNITLWYAEQYQVLLGNQDRLDYKVDCMAQAVSQMNSYQSGVLDVSFTIWQDEVGYTPFA